MGLLKTRPALTITLAAVVLFGVSFAVLWRAEQADTTPAVPAPVPPVAVPPAPMVPGPMTQTTTEPSRPVSPAPPVTRPLPQVGGQPLDPDVSGPMPIGINVYNRRAKQSHEGYVANTSNKPLTVTLDLRDAEGRDKATRRFELPGGGRQDFSSDSDFDMQPNDRIVVHSDHYDDITVTVP